MDSLALALASLPASVQARIAGLTAGDDPHGPPVQRSQSLEAAACGVARGAAPPRADGEAPAAAAAAAAGLEQPEQRAHPPALRAFALPPLARGGGAAVLDCALAPGDVGVRRAATSGPQWGLAPRRRMLRPRRRRARGADALAAASRPPPPRRAAGSPRAAAPRAWARPFRAAAGARAQRAAT